LAERDVVPRSVILPATRRAIILISMCARFELNVTGERVLEHFGLHVPPATDPEGGGLARLPLDEVRPTDRVPVIGPRRLPVALIWGLAVDWDRKPIFNARAETLAEKPTFRRLVGNRCLVPATAFFEWSGASSRPQGKRLRHRIARADGALSALAGLVDPDGGRFTIITRTANDQMSSVHPRMPVILDPEAEAVWLNPDLPFADVRPLLNGWRGPLAIQPGP